MSHALHYLIRRSRRLPGWRRPGGAAAGLVLVLAVSVVSGCGGGPGGSPPGAAAHGTRTRPVTTSAQVAGHGLGGHGELAVIAGGRLFLTGGPAGALRRVSLPGVPSAPAWSANHRWLAVQVAKPPPGGNAFVQPEPAALWLVSAAGTDARRLTPTSWDIRGFAWSPRSSGLAVAAAMPAPKDTSYTLAVVTTDGARKILAGGSYVSGVAWSPDGKRIAAGVAHGYRGRTGWQSRLELMSPGGPHPHVVLATRQNLLELAGWWPDGSGLLYWADPQGSSSMAADGLPLASVPLPGHGPHHLVTTLVHSSWLAFAPDGRTVAAVAGDSRVIWDGHKKITRCRATGGCSPVAQTAGVVSLDPSWSPDGKRLVFARASASGPFGPAGHADFSPYWMRRWQATSRLWIAGAGGSGARPLTAAGPGALAPVWGSDGSLLFVRDDSVWLLASGATQPVKVAGPLDALAAQTYDGYVPYPQLMAWTLAGRTAGTS